MILPINFKNDIQSKDTNLQPIVIIGNYVAGLSTESELDGQYKVYSTNTFSFQAHSSGTKLNAKPLLLSVPSLKESLDINDRKYKISNVTLKLSNTDSYSGERFSDVHGEVSLMNTEVRIFWKSPSSNSLEFRDQRDLINSDYVLDDAFFHIYYGHIRKYTHNEETVSLVIEDKSQSKIHKTLPLSTDRLPSDDTILDDYKGKPIPMVYGSGFKAPCVIGSIDVDEESLIQSNQIPIYADKDGSGSSIEGGDPVFIFTGSYIRIPYGISADVFGYESGDQYSVSANKILLIGGPQIINSAIPNNSIIGYEHLIATPNSLTVWREVEREDPNRVYKYTTNSEITSYFAGNFNKRISGTWMGEENLDNWDGSSYLEQSGVHTFDFEYPPDDVTWWTDRGDNTQNEACSPGFSLMFPATSSNNFTDSAALLSITGQWRWDNGNYSVAGGTPDVSFYIWSGAGGAYDPNSNTPFNATMDWDSGRQTFNQDSSYSFPTNKIKITNPSSVHMSSLVQYANSGAGFGALHCEISNMTMDHYMLIDDWLKAKFFATVQGRIAHPSSSQAIADILQNELGVGNIVFYGNVNTLYDFKCAFSVNETIDSKKLIEELSSVSTYIPRFNNMGEFKFDVIPEHGYKIDDMTAGNNIYVDHTIKANECINYSYSRTDISSVYGKVEFSYHYDYGLEDYTKKAIATSNNWEEVSDYYGIERPEDNEFADATLVIDDRRGRYIRSEAEAERYAAWLLEWHTNQHLVLKVRLPLGKYLSVEVGELLEFDSIIGNVRPYSIDYSKDAYFNSGGIPSPGNLRRGFLLNNQQILPSFICTSTNKTLDYVEISCVQLVNLGNTSVFGGDVPLSFIIGCTNAGAINWNPDANINDGSCVSINDFIQSPLILDGESFGNNHAGNVCFHQYSNTDPTNQSTNWVGVMPTLPNEGVQYQFENTPEGIEQLTQYYLNYYSSDPNTYAYPELFNYDFCVFENQSEHYIGAISIFWIDENGVENRLGTPHPIDIYGIDLNSNTDFQFRIPPTIALKDYLNNNDRKVDIKIKFHLLDNTPTSTGTSMDLRAVLRSFEIEDNIESPTVGYNVVKEVSFTGGGNQIIELTYPSVDFNGFIEHLTNPLDGINLEIAALSIYPTGSPNSPEISFGNIKLIIDIAGGVGDINQDFSYNVLDIVALANCVINNNCDQYGNIADMNDDESYNVLDIVALANCVLNANCEG